jgi:hypothetical protein
MGHLNLDKINVFWYLNSVNIRITSTAKSYYYFTKVKSLVFNSAEARIKQMTQTLSFFGLEELSTLAQESSAFIKSAETYKG